MRTVVVGEHEIDRCATCGALWFDVGEIRELTEGHVPFDGGEPGAVAGREAAAPVGPNAAAPAAPNAAPPAGPGDAVAPDWMEAAAPGGIDRGVLRKMHREALRLSCPRCSGALQAIDFQTTGVPVFACVDCRGYLAPRRSAAGINARFAFIRAHRGAYAALGEAMANQVRRRMGPAGSAAAGGSGAQIPLPIFVPLRDNAPALQSFPVVTYLLIGLSVFLYGYFQISGIVPRLPGGIPGIPSGRGLGAVPGAAILASPFVHAGIVPLLVGVLFLFVLGDDVEDRVGRLPFVVLYLLCGAAAGVAHLLWGKAGHPAALGSAGAVAGVLGAYLVFFPQVSITMYGLGKLASVPAYVFACAWIVAAFLIGPGLLTDLINPAPLSVAGNLAGFGMGALAAIGWRLLEEATGR